MAKHNRMENNLNPGSGANADLIIAAIRSGSTVLSFDYIEDIVRAEFAQDLLISDLGWTASAWKLGASTHGARAALGLEHCFSGLLPSQRVLASHSTIGRDAVRQRGAECELAVTLNAAVEHPDGPWTIETVGAAVASVHAAIEVPESRFQTLGAFGPLALVADNGAAGWAIIGPAADPELLERFDVATLSVDGVVVASGTVEAFVMPPLGLLADHLNRVSARGYVSRAGEAILLGSVTPYVPVAAGSTVHVDFGAIGSATLIYG